MPPSHSTEGVLMRRMRTGRDAAPAGSASSAGPPGASGVTARPNYVGPSGNGLVERMNAGAKNPAGSRSLAIAAPFRFQKAVPRTKEKRRGEAPIGAPARVMDRLFPSAEGTGFAVRRATGCGVPHQRLSALRPLGFWGLRPLGLGRHSPQGGRAHAP